MCLRAGIIGIQFAHDIAHSVAASARNVTLGVPVYVPSLQVCSRNTMSRHMVVCAFVTVTSWSLCCAVLQIGTFGSILRFASFPKNRNDMFDVSMAGPLVGTLLSFVAYAVGTNQAPSLPLPHVAL